MTPDDYSEILDFTRRMLRDAGFFVIDERTMSDIRKPDDPFSALIYILERLTEEIALGSNDQISRVLSRVNRHAQTESGETIQGIRVNLSGEGLELFKRPHIDFTSDPKLDQVAQELRKLIKELIQDNQGNSNQSEEE